MASNWTVRGGSRHSGGNTSVRVRSILGVHPHFRCLALNNKNRFVVTCTENLLVLWEYQVDRQLVLGGSGKQHLAAITSLTCDPSGMFLASVDIASVVIIWDVSGFGVGGLYSDVLRMKLHQNSQENASHIEVAFSTDGQSIAILEINCTNDVLLSAWSWSKGFRALAHQIKLGRINGTFEANDIVRLHYSSTPKTCITVQVSTMVYHIGFIAGVASYFDHFAPYELRVEHTINLLDKGQCAFHDSPSVHHQIESSEVLQLCVKVPRNVTQENSADKFTLGVLSSDPTATQSIVSNARWKLVQQWLDLHAMNPSIKEFPSSVASKTYSTQDMLFFGTTQGRLFVLYPHSQRTETPRLILDLVENTTRFGIPLRPPYTIRNIVLDSNSSSTVTELLVVTKSGDQFLVHAPSGRIVNYTLAASEDDEVSSCVVDWITVNSDQHHVQPGILTVTQSGSLTLWRNSVIQLSSVYTQDWSQPWPRSSGWCGKSHQMVKWPYNYFAPTNDGAAGVPPNGLKVCCLAISPSDQRTVVCGIQSGLIWITEIDTLTLHDVKGTPVVIDTTMEMRKSCNGDQELCNVTFSSDGMWILCGFSNGEFALVNANFKTVRSIRYCIDTVAEKLPTPIVNPVFIPCFPSQHKLRNSWAVKEDLSATYMLVYQTSVDVLCIVGFADDGVPQPTIPMNDPLQFHNLDYYEGKLDTESNLSGMLPTSTRSGKCVLDGQCLDYCVHTTGRFLVAVSSRGTVIVFGINQIVKEIRSSVMFNKESPLPPSQCLLPDTLAVIPLGNPGFSVVQRGILRTDPTGMFVAVLLPGSTSLVNSAGNSTIQSSTLATDNWELRILRLVGNGGVVGSIHLRLQSPMAMIWEADSSTILVGSACGTTHCIFTSREVSWEVERFKASVAAKSHKKRNHGQFKYFWELPES